MKTATVGAGKQPRRRGWTGRTLWLVLLTAAMTALLTGCPGGLNTEAVDSTELAAGEAGDTDSSALRQADDQGSQAELAAAETQSGTEEPAGSTDGPSDSAKWLVTRESVETGVFTLEYGQKGGIVEEEDSKTWVLSEDGADEREALRVRVSVDGTWTFEYPNGMKAEYRTDQTMKVTDPAGVRISVVPDIETVMEIPDGTVQTRRKNGSLLTAYPDGAFSTLTGMATSDDREAQASNCIQLPFGVSVALKKNNDSENSGGKGYIAEDVKGLPFRGEVSFNQEGNAVITYPGDIQLLIQTNGRNVVSFPNGVSVIAAGEQYEFATITVPGYVVDSFSSTGSTGDAQSILSFTGIAGKPGKNEDGKTIVKKGGSDSALAVEYPDGTKRTTNSYGAVTAEYPGGVTIESSAGKVQAVQFSDGAVPEAAFPFSAVVKPGEGASTDHGSPPPVSNPDDSQSTGSPAVSDGSNSSEPSTAVSGREEEVPPDEETNTDPVPSETDKSKGMLSGIFLKTILLAAVFALIIIGIIYIIYQQNQIKEMQRKKEEDLRKREKDLGRSSYNRSELEHNENNTTTGDTRVYGNSGREPETGWGGPVEHIEAGGMTLQARFGAMGSEEPGKNEEILLVKKSDGELIGEPYNGSYDVRPVMDSDSDSELSGYINERILRHSAVSACFTIHYNGHEGSKYRISIDSLARLEPVRKRSRSSVQEYALGRKGIITVTDAW